MKRKLSRTVLLFFGLTFVLSPVNPGNYNPDAYPPREPEDPAFLYVNPSWADSIMAEMSLDDKIAQMMMVQAYSNRGDDHLAELEKLVRKYKIGGIIFFQGTPVRQARMTNRLQEVSDVPILVAMDAEWGLSMRLEGVPEYPRQMQLGAIEDNSLLYELGQDMASQLKELGVHMNFAPVVDVNNNPENPVINTRSFGENKYEVAEKAIALFKGMQSSRILVTAKHFPGHGDTDTDSHHALPVLPFDRNRLDSLELYPFSQTIQRGISGIMVAHLHVPELDNRENRPTTLSENVVSGLLQSDMDFKGLVVTDAMNMKGASNFFKPGELEAEAVKAGNDILLMPTDVHKAINQVKKAIRSGDISEEDINNSCKKILLAKAWLGLDEQKKIELKGLDERLNDQKYHALQHKIAESSITLIRDREELLPLGKLEELKLATLNIGIDATSPFTQQLDLYHSADHFFYPEPSSFPADSILKKELAKYNTILVNLYYTRSFGNNFDIPEGVSSFINSLDGPANLILTHFGYPYALDVLGSLDNMDAIIVAYTNDELQQNYTAQAIFGGSAFRGKLPVSIKLGYSAGTGIFTEEASRLGYGIAELVDMDPDTLRLIDAIVEHAIREQAMPGCQVLVARKGKVVLNKAYGYHTYRKRQAVALDDIYDLASITKIASTIPSLMMLEDRGQFSSDSSLGSFYNFEPDTSAKADLQIADILTHQAGLKAWIPFYYNTIEPLDTSQSLISNRWTYTYALKIGPGAYANRNITYVDSIYESEFSEEYPVSVARGLYMRSDYRDTMYKHILQSPLGEKEYKYSDLGYYLFYKSIEELTDTLFYPFNWYHFYGPLGAETMGFLPLNRFDEKRIVPTENDVIFRKQLLRGYVHDPGAAMLGGICGHAGLFSSANDLAKLMQMYLNGGTYGGRRFIDSTTLAKYTAQRYPGTENRRGLGFDRPITDEEDAGPACDQASARSFGHTGFTGTIAWVDPEYDLVYIFLSNRIHPDQANTKIVSMNVRTDIQEVLYKALKDK